MDDLTAERYDPRRVVKMAAFVDERRRKPRPVERAPSPPSSWVVIEKRRRILLGQESPGDRVGQETVTPQRN